ncbi:hypothetical protein CRENPOLYSF2_2370006 [Crenothrix polyspora]|uniref:Uncharacterized protein n=1 Tax=Crenothrix polyspora TaxID=360316 RepID=A0A1R4H6C6_9GAMM|nr:hypothetical protein CRENPOLYSF2_2370006 [Crenothrix polyspora]
MDDPGFEEQLEIGREFMREYADTFQALTIRCERKPHGVIYCFYVRLCIQ